MLATKSWEGVFNLDYALGHRDESLILPGRSMPTENEQLGFEMRSMPKV